MLILIFVVAIVGFFYWQLFARMVADRAPAVKSLQETGQEILKSADEDSKVPIEQGLADVVFQWKELNAMVNSRKDSLESAMEAAVKYDKLLSHVSSELTTTTEKLQAQQLRQKATCGALNDEATKLEVKKITA